MTQPLTIDFVADYVCPWCYLGWRRLEQALAQRPEVEARIVWRPFQLDPTTPPEGVDRAAHLAAKFPDRARLDEAHDRLAEGAKAAGLDMRLREVAKIPNTNAAHRLTLWARANGDGPQMAERLFRAYWTELRDIGDPGVLAEIAAESGLNGEGILEWLNSGQDKHLVEREYLAASRSGVTGVPFMIFGGRVAVSGAESPERLVQAIDKALELAAA